MNDTLPITLTILTDMLIMMKSLKMIEYSLFDHVRGNPKIQWICFLLSLWTLPQEVSKLVKLFRWALILHYIFSFSNHYISTSCFQLTVWHHYPPSSYGKSHPT
jgi:hypothetical protein